VTDPTTIHNTFVVERSYAKPPTRVFAAFADPAQKRRWYADGKNHHTDAYELDFRVGGAETSSYRMGETTPFPGAVLATTGIIEDIVPEQRIVISSTMSLGGRRISSALITFEFIANDGGCDLIRLRRSPGQHLDLRFGPFLAVQRPAAHRNHEMGRLLWDVCLIGLRLQRWIDRHRRRPHNIHLELYGRPRTYMARNDGEAIDLRGTAECERCNC